VTRICRGVVALGLAAVVAALVLALWPLHGNGVSGSALRPHIAREFGFTTYKPLPANPTRSQLRAAGIVFPSDVVERRRHQAAAIGALGLIVVVAAVAMGTTGAVTTSSATDHLRNDRG
jgi:hypothetical protein